MHEYNVFLISVLHCQLQISQVTKDASGLLSVALEKIGSGDIDHIKGVDTVLLAIGRNPNTDNLNLSSIVSSTIDSLKFYN